MPQPAWDSPEAAIQYLQNMASDYQQAFEGIAEALGCPPDNEDMLNAIRDLQERAATNG